MMENALKLPVQQVCQFREAFVEVEGSGKGNYL